MTLWGEGHVSLGRVSLPPKKLEGCSEVFSVLTETNKKDGDRLLSRACCDRTRVMGLN